MLSNYLFGNMNKGLDISSNVIMSYNPNDWFYLAVENENNINNDMPTLEDCSNNEPYHHQWDISCNSTNLSDNQYDCMVRSLCVNRDQAQVIAELEVKNFGIDTKFNDDYRVYYNTLANTANLGIGIVVLLAVLYKTAFSTT